MKDIVIIILERLGGELFVHQRRGDKCIFPSLYGLGAGGSCEEGEEPLAAAKRELQEETGLEIDIASFCEISFESPELSHNLNVFRGVVGSKIEIETDASEWQWSGWMSLTEIKNLDLNGGLCPDTSLVFEKYTQSLANL